MPLLPMARSVIASVTERVGRDFLFGQRSTGGFTGYDGMKKAFDARLGKAVAPWRLHDLRRTVATRMVDLGVEPHIVEAVLNHYSGHRRGAAGTYNRSKYEKQIKTALATWDDHLQSLIDRSSR